MISSELHIFDVQDSTATNYAQHGGVTLGDGANVNSFHK